MDIKKFFDQTVREVKREVNKKVLKVPEIEQKVYEATSNEPWGPHGTLMGDIAQATRNFNEYQMIMSILWKRLNDTGKNWRHVYKSLTVLEYLVANGAERIIDELREHAYQVQTLVDFQYVEPSGKDQGINVRKKAQTLVGLLNDKDKIREVRNKAAANREKYRGVSSNGSFSKASSYSGSGGHYGSGGYGDRDQDEDRYGGSSRNGGRDDDRYGDRDRDRDERHREDRYRDDRYRDDDRSTKDSSGERYREDRDRDRDRYEDDRYASKGGDGYSNDKYGDDNKYEGSGSGSNNRDRDRDRSFEEDERYPPRRRSDSGNKSEDFSQDGREPTGLAAAVARAHTSQANLSQTSSNASQAAASQGTTERKAAPPVLATATSGGGVTSVGGSYFSSQPSASTEEFDDFDPRGSGSFSATNTMRRDDDSFSSTANPAPVSVSMPSLAPVKSSNGLEDLFGDQGFETSFVAVPPTVSNTSIQGNGLQSEELFGSSTFSVAKHAEPSASAPGYFPAAPMNNLVNGNFSTYTSVNSNESGSSFGMGTFMEGAPANPASMPSHNSFAAAPPPMTSTFSSNSFQAPSGSIQAPTYPYASGFDSQGSFPQFSSGGYTSSQGSNVGPQGPGINAQGPAFTTQVPAVSTQGKAYTSQGPAVNTNIPSQQKPPQKPFQTKSSIWSDTISSGLIDLNISGPKTNPLAELGIELKDSIFSVQEKRKEEKAQPTAGSMGRAMGSGTGLGLAGAGGIAPPPAPMMGGMGMGMGIGGTASRQPSMGMSMGVNGGYGMGPGIGANPMYGVGPGMGLNPGYGVPPSMGMAQGMGMNPGMGVYNPGLGMGPGGGYGQGMGLSGYSTQQQQYTGFR